jgi:hypothetical protein
VVNKVGSDEFDRNMISQGPNFSGMPLAGVSEVEADLSWNELKLGSTWSSAFNCTLTDRSV